jgi:DNA invertase Pin-like site-specific DNA recombinase
VADRECDVLMVTRIDRLARSIGDLQDIVRAVRARGASLKATEQPIDTSTAAGKCFLDMLGVFAERSARDRTYRAHSRPVADERPLASTVPRRRAWPDAVRPLSAEERAQLDELIRKASVPPSC